MQSDVYSLAMVVLETYTKAAPFDEIYESDNPRFIKILADSTGAVTKELKNMEIRNSICNVN